MQTMSETFFQPATVIYFIVIVFDSESLKNIVNMIFVFRLYVKKLFCT